MMDPLSYYLFQPMLHNWYNKGLLDGAYKTYLVANRKRVAHVVAAAGLLFKWSFTIYPTPYNCCSSQCSTTGVTKAVVCAILLIGKSSLCGSSGFPLLLSEWSFTICLTPYNRK